MNDYAHMQWIKLKFKLEHVCEEGIKVFNDWVNTDKKSRPAHKKHSKE